VLFFIRLVELFAGGIISGCVSTKIGVFIQTLSATAKVLDPDRTVQE
jgi:hypothetical protein